MKPIGSITRGLFCFSTVVVGFFQSVKASEERIFTIKPSEQRCAAALLDETFRRVAEISAAEQPESVVIEFATGTHRFTETFVLNQEKLGSFSGRLILRGEKGSEPRLTASLPVTDWRSVRENLWNEEVKSQIWEAPLPSEHLPKALIDSDGLLKRSQSSGFVPLEKGTLTTFHFPPELILKGKDLKSLELSVRPFYLWAHNILSIASLNPETGVATTALPATYPLRPLKAWGDTIKESAWFENAPEWIDAPGTWAASAREGKIYLWPRDGQRPGQIEVPQFTEILRIEGDEANEKPLRRIEIRGLTFTGAERESLQLDDKGLQHDWDFMDKANAMLRLRWVEDITVANCSFVASGSSGMRADLLAQRVTVRENRFEDLGGGAILFCGYGPGTVDLNKNNLIADNVIERCARLIWHMPGIHLWQSGENRVVRNQIRNLPYSGIIVSGNSPLFFKNSPAPRRELERTIRWDEVGEGPYTTESIQPYLHTRNNLIAHNVIEEVMETLGDGNGIYIRFASETGNVIRGNYVGNIFQRYNAGGIRCDGSQNGVLIEGNLIHRVQHAGISSNGLNTIRNNFLVDILNEGNFQDLPTTFFRGYIVLWNDFVHGSEIESNVFYDSGSGDPEFFFRTYARWLGDKAPELAEVNIRNNLFWVKGNPGWAEDFAAMINENRTDGGNGAVNPVAHASKDDSPEFSPGILEEFSIKPFQEEDLPGARIPADDYLTF